MRDRLLSVGLGYQVSIGIAILMTVAFAAFGWQAIRVSQEGAQHTLEQRVVRLSEATAVAADAWIRHEIAQFSGIADSRAIAAVMGDAAAGRRVLDDMSAAMQSVAGLRLVDPTGRILAESSPDGAGLPAATELGQLAARALAADVVQLGPLQPLDGDHPGSVMLVKSVGRAAAPMVLAGNLQLFDRREKLLPSVRDGFPIAVAIVDRSGRLIAGEADPGLGPDALREVASATQALHADISVVGSRDGQQEVSSHFVAFAPLAEIPAGVVLEIPPAMIESASSDLPAALWGFGAVALAVAAVGAWIHARWVTGPLRSLEAATQRLAKGDLDSPLLSTRRSDEVGRLTAGFDEMRRQLKVADAERRRGEAELEGRVADRTRQVRRLLDKIIGAQEAERGRLARELHDETAQTLATTLVAAEAIRRSLGPDQADQRELIESVLAQGKATLGDVRRIVMDLRPSVLDNMALPEAIASWAEQRLAVAGVTLEVQRRGHAVPLGHAAEIGVFRIFQEAVNNVVRHAQASHARMQLEFSNEAFMGGLADDGIGFDATAGRAADDLTGIGLQSMRERAELLGADLRIESAPGRGTTVRLIYPLDDQHEEPARDGRHTADVG